MLAGNNEVQETFSSVQQLLANVCTSFDAGLTEVGLDAGQLQRPAAEACMLRDNKADQEIAGEWLNQDGMRVGFVVFRASGAIYGELGVHQPHPNRPGKFVEAIEVWGTHDELIHEVCLISA